MGKQFDALVVDVEAPSPKHPVFDVFQKDTFDVCVLGLLMFAHCDITSFISGYLDEVSLSW